MDRNEWENMSDPEVLLRAESSQLTPRQMRLFACECCRRISHICDDPIYLKVLEIAEERASGSISHDRLIELKPEYDRVYHILYPGYGTPSAAALALVAVGEAAYRESALDAAISASSTAAEAMASSAATPVDDDHYDEVHEATFRSERQAQSELLRQLDSAHDGK